MIEHIYLLFILLFWFILNVTVGGIILKTFSIILENKLENFVVTYLFGHAIVCFIVMLLGFFGLFNFQINWVVGILSTFIFFIHFDKIRNGYFYLVIALFIIGMSIDIINILFMTGAFGKTEERFESQ